MIGVVVAGTLWIAHAVQPGRLDAVLVAQAATPQGDAASAPMRR